MESMIKRRPLKKESKTTTEVHPGTAILSKSFLMIKYKPKQNDEKDITTPTDVKNFKGSDV